MEFDVKYVMDNLFANGFMNQIIATKKSQMPINVNGKKLLDINESISS